MIIFAGKMGLRVLQSHAFLAPWVLKKNAIRCSMSRDYSSSSIPARYIPKKSRISNSKFSNFDINKLKTRQQNQMDSLIDDPQDDSMEESPELSVSVHQTWSLYSDRNLRQSREYETKNDDDKFPTRFNLDMKPQYQTQRLAISNPPMHKLKQDDYKEEPFEFEDSDNDNSVEEREDELSEGDDVMEKQDQEAYIEESSIYQLKNKYDMHDGLRFSKPEAENAALKLLAARAYTTFELRKKLCEKRFSPDIVEEVLKELQISGWLNDRWYAEVYCRSKWSSSTWGPQRIKKHLWIKGINNIDSENAIEIIFKDRKSEDDDDHENSSHGISKTSMDRLLIQVSKQWSKGSDLPQEKRKARIIRWLQYRGFNWDVVGFVLKKLESDHQ